jgi:6,7-dimethyl-8-ribityllumazine synthase
MATSGKNLSEFDKQKLPDAADMRIGIVVSEWNDAITENLYTGCHNTLIKAGVPEKNISRLNVPGTFELTYGAQRMVANQRFDALVVIGCVIQGETRHFDFVCDAVTQGISHLNATQSVPVIFCVLTDNTLQQSMDRSGGKHGNKGTEAAVAAIKMAAIKRRKVID